MKQLKAIGSLTDLQCYGLDAYSLTYLNKSLNSHQISAIADLALLEDLSVPIRHEWVFHDCRDLFMESDVFISQGLFFWNYATIWNLN